EKCVTAIRCMDNFTVALPLPRLWRLQSGKQRTLDAVGQAALLVELAEVRGERPRGGGPQRRGRVRPRAVEQLVDRATPLRQRLDQPSLAVEPVLDVLREL